jgi:DNA recombination protein RmuC
VELLLGILAILGWLAAGWLWVQYQAAKQRASAAEQAEQRLSVTFKALAADVLAQNSRQFLELAHQSLGKYQAAAESDLASRQSAIESIVKPLGEAVQQLQLQYAQLGETLGRLSADALAQNTRQFLELARESLGKYQAAAEKDLASRQSAIESIVKPLGEAVQQLQLQYAQLGEQLRRLSQDQQNLQSETARLVQALRTPAARGRWGEIQLRRVVEMAGMVEYCDFLEQPTGGDGGRLRPDMIIKLPNERQVVVDAKAPLKAYLEALEAPDEASRLQKLREHASQLRAHVQRLSEKQYWDQFSPAPEFAVLFVPGEAFFAAALEQDPELIQFGAEKRVLVATPVTLIALLRAVAYGWREARLAESARQISELGRTLYERLGTLAGHFDKLRRALENAVEAYNDAAGSLERRVLAAARRFQDLGAAGSSEIATLNTVDRVPRRLAISSPSPTPDSDPDRDPPAG